MKKRWFLVGVILAALVLVFTAGAMAGDTEYPITDEEVTLQNLDYAREDMKAAMRQAPMNAPKLLETPIDWFTEFLNKLMQSGNAFIVFEKIDEAYPGVEATFWESDTSHVQVTVGYIFDRNCMIYQVKTDRLPLIGEWSEIFQKFEPGIGLIGGEEARFLLTLRYDWKNDN